MGFSILPRTLRRWMIVIAVVSLPMGVVAWYRRLDRASQIDAVAAGPWLVACVLFLFAYDQLAVGRNRHKKKRR